MDLRIGHRRMLFTHIRCVTGIKCSEKAYNTIIKLCYLIKAKTNSTII